MYDEDTAMYYLQTRYYDPTTGRFINADNTAFISSSGTAIGDNIYTYCENDPVNNVDYTGQWYHSIKKFNKRDGRYPAAAKIQKPGVCIFYPSGYL